MWPYIVPQINSSPFETFRYLIANIEETAFGTTVAIISVVGKHRPNKKFEKGGKRLCLRNMYPHL